MPSLILLAASPVTVGLVGYPNVGKSSTINTLLRQKKVPVSATPGCTKHFQVQGESLRWLDFPGVFLGDVGVVRDGGVFGDGGVIREGEVVGDGRVGRWDGWGW